jgi:hypothetical protein
MLNGEKMRSCSHKRNKKPKRRIKNGKEYRNGFFDHGAFAHHGLFSFKRKNCRTDPDTRFGPWIRGNEGYR